MKKCKMCTYVCQDHEAFCPECGAIEFEAFEVKKEISRPTPETSFKRPEPESSVPEYNNAAKPVSAGNKPLSETTKKVLGVISGIVLGFYVLLFIGCWITMA